MLESGTLARMLEQLRAEQAAAEAQLANLQRRVNSLRQAVTGIQGLLEAETVVIVDAEQEASVVAAAASQLQASGNQPSVSAPDHPRGAEAILRVLSENEGTGWTVQEMTAELERRGWTPNSKNPVDAVRTAMTRVWKAPNSGIVRDGSKFLYRPSHNGDGPSASREGVSGDQEMSEAELTFTGDSQQPDKSSEQ
jgi:hypothetical protein